MDVVIREAVPAADREVGSRMVMTLDTQALHLEDMRVPTVVTDARRRAIVPVQGLATYDFAERAAQEMGVLLGGNVGLWVPPPTIGWGQLARSSAGADDGDPAKASGYCNCKGRRWRGKEGPFPCNCSCANCLQMLNDKECIYPADGYTCNYCS